MNAAVGLIAKRLAAAVLTLLLVSVVVFSIAAVLPGDAAQEMLGQNATPAAVAALRAQLGLDQPAYLRYLHWLGGAFFGNAGHSLSNNMPVSTLIASRLPNSLILVGLTSAVSVPFALLLGIMSAIYRGSFLDRALNVATLSLVAVPEFLVASLAVLLFAVELRWLPALVIVPEHATVGEFLRAYAIPVMTLCFVVMAQMVRMTRAAIINQLDKPYVEMAMLKGVSNARIVFYHIIPNAIGPIANATAFSMSYLLGGVIIVETIFNYAGLASLMVDAVTARDMPLLLACAMLFCAAYLLLVLLADICSIFANPKLRAK
jgi:peptide/nickel transport system permease protein